MSNTAPEYHSILVCICAGKDNALGENIIKLPLLRALRIAFPQTQITVIPGYGTGPFTGAMWPLVKGDVAEAIIDCVMARDFCSALAPRRPLPGRRFDLIIDVQQNLYVDLQLRKIPHRRFITTLWRYNLSDARPPADFAPYRKTRQLAVRLLGAAAAAAGRAIMPSPAWPVAEKWHARAAALLPSEGGYVGFAPGGGNRSSGKLWPVARFIELARGQHALGRRPVFILGPEEGSWISDLRAAAPEALFPQFDGEATALWDLRLTIALAGRLSVAVSNCSGTGHLLAAGGAPMVSLFGPTDPAKYKPYAVANEIIRSQDFGCTAAMDAIPVTAVSTAIDRCIAAAQANRNGRIVSSEPAHELG